jgi:hypothetical protein
MPRPDPEMANRLASWPVIASDLWSISQLRGDWPASGWQWMVQIHVSSHDMKRIHRRADRSAVSTRHSGFFYAGPATPDACQPLPATTTSPAIIHVGGRIRRACAHASLAATMAATLRP